MAESLSEAEKSQLSEKERYFSALRCWLQQAQLAQATACWPYYWGLGSGVSLPPPLVPPNNNFQAPYYQLLQGQLNARRTHNTFTEADDQSQGTEYVIPPLWKRFLAEQFDFVLLVLFKILVTFVFGDFMGVMYDVEKYDVDTVSQKLQEDYHLALEMIAEIMLIELIFRLVACIFEAICLSGVMGGATPGKALLGLRVVTARTVEPCRPGPTGSRSNPRAVMVRPAGPLPFSTSLLRAFLKNSFIALLFPVFTLTFFSQHSRTAYDLLCNVLVVEENIEPPRRARQ